MKTIKETEPELTLRHFRQDILEASTVGLTSACFFVCPMYFGEGFKEVFGHSWNDFLMFTFGVGLFCFVVNFFTSNILRYIQKKWQYHKPVQLVIKGGLLMALIYFLNCVLLLKVFFPEVKLWQAVAAELTACRLILYSFSIFRLALDELKSHKKQAQELKARDLKPKK